MSSAASRYSLAGKVAVVCGGSSGIGRSSALRLAEAGATVYVSYNNGKERAEAVVASLAPPSGDEAPPHASFRLVLEDPASTKAAAEAVGALCGGKVDVLVNSAGFTKPVAHADLEKLDEALFSSVLQANVVGVYSTIRAFHPLLKASGDAVVVNVSSISGFTGSGSSVAYCASKAAIDNITMSLGRALGPQVRVLAVSPGAVDTDFVAGRSREQLEKIAQGTPLKAVVSPEDVAEAVMACVYLKRSTGTRIVCDGGRFLV
ncbi:short-chain dehydrogenase/reductase SDR [Hyaloraphidium curvatum]|nr:short-chain dehydrogenase/reductase SDR [Hyaloraphidium curvatum]